MTHDHERSMIGECAWPVAKLIVLVGARRFGETWQFNMPAFPCSS